MLGLSQQRAAERLSVQPSALSNWEHGTRAISIDYEQLDDLLEGNGVLAGLLWSVVTPGGLEPDVVWTHVFAGPSTPVWAWVRSPSSQVRVIGEWGVARFEAELDLGPNGSFFTLGVSVAESPAVVMMSEPGWVDFGRGSLPTDVPGAEVFSTFDLFRRSSANGSFMQLFIAQMASKLKSAKSRDFVAMATMAPRAALSFVSGLSRPQPIDTAGMTWQDVPEHIDEFERLRFSRLRRSRGMSLADTVDVLVKQADISISKETLRRFETDVGQPHDRLLPIALDHVLGGGGNLGLTTLRTDSGSGLTTLPPFWMGPLWLELDGPGEEQEIRLRWGDWYRSVRVVPPALLWFTCCTPEVPIRIMAGPDVRWSMGVGRRLGAVSINQNWAPATIDVAHRALSETEHAFVRAMRLRQTPKGR